MALKIRLRQQGRTNQLSYRLVLTDIRAPRDGKYLECLGWYDPKRKVENDDAELKADRIEHWLKEGAEISPKACALLKRIAPSVYQSYHQMCTARRLKKNK
ncbi:MAG: 30S ribosomal protein S16 [Chlamydiales bacterium]|nr:30S ribosomal protein S16 [Chlamydiales bacterium]